MTKKPIAYPSDETIRKIRHEADTLAEEARLMKEIADERAQKAKERLERIVERDDARLRDPKRKP